MLYDMFLRYAGIGFFRFWLVSMHPRTVVSCSPFECDAVFNALINAAESLGPGRHFRVFTGCGIGRAQRLISAVPDAGTE